MKEYQKSISRIQEELDKNFVIAFPRIIQKDIEFYQLVARSIFEIDPALKKVGTLEGIRGVRCLYLSEHRSIRLDIERN